MSDMFCDVRGVAVFVDNSASVNGDSVEEGSVVGGSDGSRDTSDGVSVSWDRGSGSVMDATEVSSMSSSTIGRVDDTSAGCAIGKAGGGAAGSSDGMTWGAGDEDGVVVEGRLDGHVAGEVEEVRG